jgi:Kef-type K+ transport system membrane component KefB
VTLVILAAPVVVLAGAPVLGYAVGAGAWILQRIVAALVDRRAARASDPKTALGLGMASSMARSWLVALAILAVGLMAEREDGLTAAIVVLAAFTVYLAITLILRASERKPSR